MPKILLWDPRFPARAPHRLDLAPDIASAAVRSGVAAAADPAEAGALATGGPLDPGSPIEVVIEESGSKRLRRVILPASVATIAVTAGLAAAVGTPIASAPVAPLPTLTLSLSGPLTYATNAASGTLVANIGNVPAGITPTLTPNDGRLTIAGDQTNGWKVVKGLTASTAGTIALSVAAAGAIGASASVTVSAAVVTMPGSASNRVADWNAESLAAGVDGSAVPSWTDSIGGFTVAQGTSANQPTYMNNRYGAKPAVKFNGTQWLFGTVSAIDSLLATNNYTIMLVCGRIGASTFGYAVNHTTSTGFNIVANGAVAGENGAVNLPYTGTGFTTLGRVKSTSYPSGSGALNGTHASVLVNGGIIGTSQLAHGAPTQMGIGATWNGTGGTVFEVQRVIYFNKRLSLYEWNEWEVYFRGYYGNQPHPAVVNSCSVVFHGDSISTPYNPLNFTNVHRFSFPVVSAAAQGWPLGAWSNIANVGYQIEGVKAVAQYERVAELSGLLGVKTKNHWMEFFNTKAQPLATNVASTQAGLSYLKTAAADRVIFTPTTDYANRGAEKGSWTAYWDVAANRAGYIDGYVRMHDAGTTGASIVGVDGAAGNAAPFGIGFYGTAGAGTLLGNMTTVNGSDQITVNTVTGGSNAIVGDYVNHPSVPLHTRLIANVSGSGAGSVWQMSAAATAGTTAAAGLLPGDGIHPGQYGQQALADGIGPVMSSTN